jgi:CRISPR-associated protein (TIGR03986 family)
MANLLAHHNPKPENAAKAPYNFVPLPDQIVTVDPAKLPDQDRYYPDRHTGQIVCRLTTASPLYVRAALEWDEFVQSLEGKSFKNKPEFFYTFDRLRPAIPGSSLRGMLRGVLEIASYSKVQDVTDRRLVYRAVGDTTEHGNRYRDRLMHDDGQGEEDGKRYHLYTPLMQAGYMEKDAADEWVIRPAKRINGTTFARISERSTPTNLARWHNCKNASEIWVQPGPYEYQKVRGGFIRVKYARILRAAATQEKDLVRAVVARSGWMANKRTEAVIFEPDPNAKVIALDDDLIRDYRDHYEDINTQQSIHGGRRTSLLDAKNGVLEEHQPVFYLIENGKVVAFSHTMMMRLPYRKPLNEFVPPELRREGDLDLAEAIFGYSKSTGEGKQRAYAGRVFVSDAQLAHDQPPSDIWLSAEPVTPKILGSPKPTTFQHYLTQQNPDPIPLPGKKAAGGGQRTEMRLTDYANKTPDDTVLRGTKLYWHKGNASLEQIKEDKSVPKDDKQHTQMRPVKEGVAFEFTIRFENLNEVELGALLWVLDVAQNDAYRLKLGMGKPLGLGAVKIESTLHLEDRMDRYAHLLSSGNWTNGQPQADVREKVIGSFEALVVKRLGSRDVKSFGDIERIKMLLTMLRWPGPKPEETRYLEIEPRDADGHKLDNEYKGRPVLPNPLGLKVAVPASTRTVQVIAKAIPPGYQRGVVKDFELGPNRSFGYILPAGGGAEVFVHKNNLAAGLKTLSEGQRVIFRVGKSEKGPQAVDVQLDE